ncbi:MAG: transposase [Hyphomicrobiales bacterium]|nr:transposase [Hyphomicrobiales bacterium]
MTGMVPARYMLEFKQEAVRLAPGGQSLSSVARGLGVSAQSIDNWVKAEAVGGLKGQGQAGECRSDGDCTAEGGTGEDANGARHPK